MEWVFHVQSSLRMKIILMNKKNSLYNLLLWYIWLKTLSYGINPPKKIIYCKANVFDCTIFEKVKHDGMYTIHSGFVLTYPFLFPVPSHYFACPSHRHPRPPYILHRPRPPHGCTLPPFIMVHKHIILIHLEPTLDLSSCPSPLVTAHQRRKKRRHQTRRSLERRGKERREKRMEEVLCLRVMFLACFQTSIISLLIAWFSSSPPFTFTLVAI